MLHISTLDMVNGVVEVSIVIQFNHVSAFCRAQAARLGLVIICRLKLLHEKSGSTRPDHLLSWHTGRDPTWQVRLGLQQLEGDSV